MSPDDDLPRADQAEGAPHPRETQRLIGQQAAEQDFLTSYNSDRLHHGWLLTGPQGVGKATLAWRIARFLLATPLAEEGLFGAPPPPDTLEISPEHPVSHRIQALAEPGLAPISRSYDDKGKLRSQIVVDDIRKLNRFFGLSATDGGRRVVIVDAADDMNISAANALLKMLEEPPARTTLLLISHQPSRLLPTIRSRCRTLRLGPLSASDMEAALAQSGVELPGNMENLAALAGGSVGAALRLINLGGLKIYAELVQILATMPRLDRQRAMALAEAAAQRGASARFELLLSLTEMALARLARTGATGTPPAPEAAPQEAAMLLRLSPDSRKARAWADLAAEVTARARHGQAVNLDPAALVLDTVFKMQETASR
ncbi:DNA polymerase III subunit delta' [Leisingera methylohalidivorans]|uniref:DNA polymerase III subunit delta n=1 Tax=Leisingera methylohalidivorans DSM 14336 TaxID=999552 RepID=V9VVY9_9RHOB|nr:DNA polymerase III subunit delta' [Leisingera methylohalidivorans]AHD01540.1 DNA polymerase III subunit delta' [Leisingera methylohalidivorans DSM 14336]